MRLLNELAGNATLLRVRGAQGPDDEQETDRELILRFFAMQARGSLARSTAASSLDIFCMGALATPAK